MKETIELKHKNRPLKINGGKYDSVLYLNNTPIQFTFLREIGSTWRYQIVKGISEKDLIKNEKYSNFVKFGILTNENLFDQFEYILSILDEGKYNIELITLENDIETLEINTNQKDYYSIDIYGGIKEIIETQSSFNEQIVKQYIDLIKNSYKPIAILLKTENSENTFIIDGHHKLCAYSRLEAEAKCLMITKLNSETIDEQKGIEIFNLCGIVNETYKTEFKKGIK